MNRTSDPHRFRRFVALRRKWFWSVFGGSLILCNVVANGMFDSLVEIVGFSVIGALVLATAISLASAPILWKISGKQP